MSIDKKILKEIERHHKINNYIKEQETPLVPGLPEPEAVAPAAEIPAAPAAPAAPQKIDLATDTEVEKVTDAAETPEGGTEELHVTELVNSPIKIESKQ